MSEDGIDFCAWHIKEILKAYRHDLSGPRRGKFWKCWSIRLHVPASGANMPDSTVCPSLPRCRRKTKNCNKETCCAACTSIHAFAPFLLHHIDNVVCLLLVIFFFAVTFLSSLLSKDQNASYSMGFPCWATDSDPRQWKVLSMTTPLWSMP